MSYLRRVVMLFLYVQPQGDQQTKNIIWYLLGNSVNVPP